MFLVVFLNRIAISAAVFSVDKLIKNDIVNAYKTRKRGK